MESEKLKIFIALMLFIIAFSSIFALSYNNLDDDDDSGSDDDSESTEKGCDGIIMNEKCYGNKETLYLSKGDGFQTSYENYFLNDIEMYQCITTPCPGIQAKFSVSVICKEGQLCAQVIRDVIVDIGEQIKIDDGIYLEFMSIDKSLNDERKGFFRVIVNDDEQKPKKPVVHITDSIEDGVNLKKKLIDFDRNGRKIIIKSSTSVEVKENEIYVNKKKVKIMPDAASEKALEVLKEKNFTIELKDTGKYKVEVEKEAKLFYLIKVKEKHFVEVDSDTGDITIVKKPWWGFLAKDVDSSSEEE